MLAALTCAAAAPASAQAVDEAGAEGAPAAEAEPDADAADGGPDANDGEDGEEADEPWPLRPRPWPPRVGLPLVDDDADPAVRGLDVLPRDPKEAPKKKRPRRRDGIYRTPLAGEPYRTELFGEKIEVAERDRGNTIALNVGSTFFTPQIGENRFVPFLALFYKRFARERRARAVLSGLVNDVDYAERFGVFEGLVHVGNDSLPFPTTEIVDGREVESSALTWGYTEAWVGTGVRLKVPPWNVDNNLLLQLYYHSSYWYFAGDEDTIGAHPPDTYVHGVRFRGRLDMIQRNILELPHFGVAAGVDVAFLRRDRWRDLGPQVGVTGETQFPGDTTRDYFKLSGYFVFATKVPFLSDRHHLVGYVHAGWGPNEDLDRFNAFRLGGGPQPSEANDLSRSPYPAAMFDQFVVRDYVVATIEYRLELLFFLYLHFRGTLAYGEIPTFRGTNGPPGPVKFERRRGETYSLGVTCGFLWESVIQFEYAFDSGAVRAGEEGHTFLLIWSKSF